MIGFMEASFVVAQVFGLLASIALIVGIQFKKKASILLMMIASSIFFTINFVLLEAWSGAMVCAMGVAVSLTIFLIEKFGHQVSKPIIVIFVIAETVFWAFTYQSLIDILPLVGTYFWLASMLQKDENRLRLLLIVNYVIWIIYGVITMAYTSILADVFSIISTIIALIRYRKRDNKKISS